MIKSTINGALDLGRTAMGNNDSYNNLSLNIAKESRKLKSISNEIPDYSNLSSDLLGHTSIQYIPELQIHDFTDALENGNIEDIGKGILSNGIIGSIFNLGNYGIQQIGKNKKRRKIKEFVNTANEAIKEYNKSAHSAFAKLLELNNELQYENTNIGYYNLFGGPLYMRYSGPMSPYGNSFATGGGIHIKPENRGKFTKYCGGNVTSECIAKGKRSSDPAVRKRATFAANARNWKHAFGGDLLTQGGEWSNGLSIIGNGGTHEENPNEGVQMGIAPDGIPNLVEEGEVMFNDYVFSERLKVPKDIKLKYKLGKKKDLSFADAAKKMSKESEERPNDPISLLGLEYSLNMLTQEQEVLRLKQEAAKAKKLFSKLNPEEQVGIMLAVLDNLNQLAIQLGIAELAEQQLYAYGGRLGRRYDGYGPLSLEVASKPYASPFLQNWYTPELAADNAFMGDQLQLDNAYHTAMFNSDGTPKVTKPKRKKDDGAPVVKDDPKANDNKTDWQEYLRYAPVLGSIVGLGMSARKPDYSNVNNIENKANLFRSYKKITPTYLRGYLLYKPISRLYISNLLETERAGLREAAKSISGGNRAAALAGLISSDLASLRAKADALIAGMKYNSELEHLVALYNSLERWKESLDILNASIANLKALLEADKLALTGLLSAEQRRYEMDAGRAASMSANLSNLFSSIGDIGREAFSRNMIKDNPALYYSIDSNGHITYKNGFEDKSEAEKARIRLSAEEDAKTKMKNKLKEDAENNKKQG